MSLFSLLILVNRKTPNEVSWKFGAFVGVLFNSIVFENVEFFHEIFYAVLVDKIFIKLLLLTKELIKFSSSDKKNLRSMSMRCPFHGSCIVDSCPGHIVPALYRFVIV